MDLTSISRFAFDHSPEHHPHHPPGSPPADTNRTASTPALSSPSMMSTTFHEGDRLVVAVVIVGSGFAGLAAALQAAQYLPQDQRVLILEKQASPGGNSVRNAGQLAYVTTPEEKQACWADMQAAGQGLNHKILVDTMLDASADVVEWTKKELGVTYRDRLTQLGGHSVPRTLSTLHASGKDWIDPMLAKCRDAPNIDLWTNAAVQEFIVQPTRASPSQPPNVLGVKVTVQSQADQAPMHLSILCTHGIVLASGGFAADFDFLSIQNPSLGAPGMQTTNQPGATAEVLQAALGQLGAAPVQLSRIQLGPWTSPDEDGFGQVPLFCMGAGFPYGILVDPSTSQRFVNELADREFRSRAIFRLGHPVVCITDAQGARHSLQKDLGKLGKAVQSFYTLSELARHYHLEPLTLQQTIHQYNAGLAQLGDPLFGKPIRPDAKALTQPPFYACRIWPKVHHCMGGLQINQFAQVMHVQSHTPIPRVYAAGEVAGGVHGGDRLGSCATLDCFAFGRIAGRNVAELEKPRTFASKHGGEEKKESHH